MANRVTTCDTKISGIWVSQARNQLLLSGATPKNGGTDNTWYAGELLLAALNTCATSLLFTAAREHGINLKGVEITSESERDPKHADRYSRIHLHFDLDGVTQAQGEALVQHFKANCPIYGTVSRSAPATTTVASSQVVTS